MIVFSSDAVSCVLFATSEQSVPFAAASHSLGILGTCQFFKGSNLARVKNNGVFLLPSINAESGLQTYYSNVILIMLHFCPSSVLSLPTLNLIC